MKFALCAEVLRDNSWEEACDYMQKCGYQGTELAPFTFADSVEQLSTNERAYIRETAYHHNLEIIGLHWLLVSPHGLHATHPDRQVRRRTADYLCELTRFCRDVGGHLMTFGSPQQRTTIPPVTQHQAVENLLETIAPALSLCKEYGITFILEPLPSSETDVVNTLAEAATILKQTHHPNLRTIFDVKSAAAETNDLVQRLDEYYPLIAHVHLNDEERLAPGFGKTDFQPILHYLKSKGYEGWCSVEPFDYSPTPEIIAFDSLQYLKRCLNSDIKKDNGSDSCESPSATFE